MELMRLKGNENIIDAYSIKPTLPYNIEGVLIEKDARNIKVDVEVESKSVTYSLRLREEINENIGEQVYINKENIMSMKIEPEKEKVDVEEIKNIEEIVEKIGLE